MQEAGPGVPVPDYRSHHAAELCKTWSGVPVPEPVQEDWLMVLCILGVRVL